MFSKLKMTSKLSLYQTLFLQSHNKLLLFHFFWISYLHDIFIHFEHAKKLPKTIYVYILVNNLIQQQPNNLKLIFYGIFLIRTMQVIMD
jgi:hypothetical protein